MKLKNLKELKAQWEQREIAWHSVPEIKRDERLQPRKPETDTFRNQSIEERASANQVDGLYAQLMASSKAELTPLLVADIDGELLIVDGHHRWKAYRRANKAVPARVFKTDLKTAIAVSRITNTEDRARALTQAMLREQCWQYLMEETFKATKALPSKGYSDRDLAAAFGINYKAAQRMKARIAKHLNDEKPLPRFPEDVTELDIDSGTGMVRWKYVNKYKLTMPWENLDDTQVEAKRRATFMRKMAAIHKPLEDRQFLSLFRDYVADCLTSEDAEDADAMFHALKDELRMPHELDSFDPDYVPLAAPQLT